METKMQFGPLTLKQCRYGWMLFSGPFIGKCLELYGEYSELEVQTMRGLVRSGDVVLDIGANIGSFTLPLAQMTGNGGRVYAIESHADVFNILCANLALNQIGNVKPLNAFVRKSAAALVQEQFVRPGWDIQSIAIDDLKLEKCRLIKIDVDGNELDVLQSGENTLRALRPILYLENDIREKSKELLAYLFAQNYALYWHCTPLFLPDNFLKNPVNHWAPDTLISQMVLAVPKELGMTIVGLKQIASTDEWYVEGV
jgi:FkbM family methyltransferase